MRIQVLVSNDSETKLWGLGGRQRLYKQLARHAGTELITGFTQRDNSVPLLLVRGDYIYPDKLVAALIENSDELVFVDANSGDCVAAMFTGTAADDSMADQLNQGRFPGNTRQVPVQEFVKPFDPVLKKYEPVQVFRITGEQQKKLEDLLFGNAYKGVTDFVTKFIWPVPARFATRLCTLYGITPNQVTLAGLALVTASTVLFWFGWYGSGLVLAWLMTFLDTVDGKLARVTVSSSRLGHVLDHGMDIIHPPLWYLAWGVGLYQAAPVDTLFTLVMWTMLLAYVGGRLCEGVFELFTPITLFLWRKFDSFNRLVTARRNPNLVILTLFTLSGLPAAGLYAVISWHVISTLLLGARTVQAWRHHRAGQVIGSWMADIDGQERHDLATRLFTNMPARP